MTTFDALRPQQRECLVVGAGPVGMATALALHSLGVQATVLEAGGPGRERPGSRAVYVHNETLQLLESSFPGLGHEVAAHGLVWATKRTYYGGEQVYERTYPPRLRGGLPAFSSLSQLTTEALLRKACAEANVEFVWNAEIAEASTSDSGATLSTTDGRVWSAPFAIAADGSRSAVRKSLGISMTGSASERSFIIIDVAEVVEDPLVPERIFHYRHPAVGGRNILLAPFTGFWRADLQCFPDDNAEDYASGEGAARWIAAVLGERYADRIAWTSTYRFLQVVADRFTDVHRRILLAGESAHLFAPFGARGMNSGIADGVRAANAVRQSLDSTGEAHRGIIAGFEADRRASALHNRDAAGSALRHLTSPSPMIKVRLRAAKTVARLGARAGRYIDSAPYGPTTGRAGQAGKY